MTTRQRLVEILEHKGALSPEWAAAVAGVDRALFVPDTYQYRDSLIAKKDSPEKWARYVYGDTPLITQVNDGKSVEGGYELPTSSTSMPSLMLQMLGLLEVGNGHHVLEVGTGTGYNAAWLTHRLGGRLVTSIEMDEGVAAEARKNLRRAGLAPRLILGDGLSGVKAHAPFDRLISTCCVQEIPGAWVEQTPEGRIVTPWGNGYFSASFAVLDVSHGVATGRFSGYPAFMWARQQRPGYGYLVDYLHHEGEGTKSRTTVHPESVRNDTDARFAVAVQVSGLWSMLCAADDGSDESTLWLLADDRRSWASIEYVPGETSFEVDQYGPRRLWDEVGTAYSWWLENGRPERDAFGLTVTETGGQQVWLRTPGTPVPTVR
ncbi:methyltransferase domain-containing protein [Streptomyces sp. SID13666]|uniref:methyltransferase domain-containing protein n=1 Tax=unclassified Streptomyces TaxID=2593676 RepID=UPI0013C03362|nr:MULTISPECIES: methyltransferase domain-containing protein [unclassified Streptomyces]NEA54379.1 methyltransferase domain-containing protein [Streptomyces sp. SID13666]NEA72246.1 methyltransferase domain-containing protein [Streptomyces sp. SID13588]